MRPSIHTGLSGRASGKSILHHKRRLRFEELEARNMLAASPLDIPITTAPATPTSPTVIGAAVVLTTSVLNPTGTAPLGGIGIAPPTIGGASSTQLPVILALGQNAITATEVPNATTGTGIPIPWAPTLGMVTSLSQSQGGIPLRTESLESGPLGLLQPLSCAAHGVAPGQLSGEDNQSSPGAPNGSPADNDPYNLLGEIDGSPDTERAVDAAVLEFVSLPEDIVPTDDLPPTNDGSTGTDMAAIEPIFW